MLTAFFYTNHIADMFLIFIPNLLLACFRGDRGAIWAGFYVTFVRAVAVVADDGITIPVPILLEGEESVVEFIDLPYSGVSLDSYFR